MDGKRNQKKRKRGSPKINPVLSVIHYREAEKKEDQMELHAEVTNKETRKLEDDWKK